MSLKSYAVASWLVVVAMCLTLLVAPLSVHAQSMCIPIATGHGRGPFNITFPSWVTRVEATVDWSGLQLRLFIGWTVWGTSMFSNPYISTPDLSSGWGGTREVEFGGILVDYVGAWEIRGCGAFVPTPTPTPTPTRTPIPWPTSLAFSVECQAFDPVPLSGLGSEYVVQGSSVRIYPDAGASGDPDTEYEVIPQGMSWGPRYRGEVRLPLTSPVLVRVVGSSGLGLAFVWIEVTVCEVPSLFFPTPVVVRDDDVHDVVVGAEYVGTTCYTVMPSLALDIPIPGLGDLQWSYDGFGLCLRTFAVSLRWGTWDLMGVLWPLIAFAFLWAVYLLYRRG